MQYENSLLQHQTCLLVPSSYHAVRKETVVHLLLDTQPSIRKSEEPQRNKTEDNIHQLAEQPYSTEEFFQHGDDEKLHFVLSKTNYVVTPLQFLRLSK